MKNQKNKTKISATTITLVLIFAMTFSLIAIPAVIAQDLIMNLPGNDIDPYNVELHESIDIDLNGAHPGGVVELWVKYPGRTDFTYINGYTTAAGGDLDVYDFDFNETGDFELKWMLGAASSNVSPARVWPVGQVPAGLSEILTHIYIVGSPVTGVGQEMFLVYWTDRIPPDIGEQAGLRDKPRAGWFDVQLVITKPDGTSETIAMPYSDPVGGGYTLYTPAQVGTYSFKAVFPDTWKNSTRMHTMYTACESISQTFTVQQDPIPGWPEAPLQDDYWMRPISGASHTWQAVAGNWLGEAGTNYPIGAAGGVTQNYGYGSAPESAHILWTRSIFDSGSLVDERFGSEAYTLNHYQDVDFQALIVNGKIHYEPWYNVHYPGRPQTTNMLGYGILSLYTGEELFLDYDAYNPSFGQIYIYNSGNQHGGFEYLWRTNHVTLPEIVYLGWSSSETNTTTDTVRTGTLWEMIDGFTGNNICYVANVSAGGTSVYSKDGSLLRYDTENYGTSANPNYYLTVWNVSAIPTMLGGVEGTNYWMWRPSQGTHSGLPRRPVVHDGSTGFSLNVSIPNIQGPRNSVVNQTASIRAVREGEYVIVGTTGRNDERGIAPGWMMGVSLVPGQEGTKLWETTFTPPFDPQENYQGLALRDVVPEHNVILFSGETELIWYAYDMTTGLKLWESEPRPQLEYYSMDYNIYEDMLLASGRAGGVLTAYDLRTGDIRWNYIAEGKGTESPYGNSIIRNTYVSEGKIYVSCDEHSGSTPLWRGPNLRCLNATTGEEIWKILFWGQNTIRIADGILIGWNLYDGQVYAFGRGPSGTTVTASPKTSVHGTTVVIEGTVTDQTPTGRRNINNELQFTLKGTPAISDEDMSAWMQYKFMQQAYPKDAKGVEVVLTVFDSNNNYYEIGRTTSDITGSFSYYWTPQIEGTFTITATFEGSESYGPSSSTTAIAVDPAPSPGAPIEPEPTTPEPTTPEPTTPEPTTPEPTTPEPTTPEPTEPEPTEAAEAPFITTEIAIIAAVAVACVIGVVSFWALKKRK